MLCTGSDLLNDGSRRQGCWKPQRTRLVTSICSQNSLWIWLGLKSGRAEAFSIKFFIIKPSFWQLGSSENVNFLHLGSVKQWPLLAPTVEVAPPPHSASWCGRDWIEFQGFAWAVDVLIEAKEMEKAGLPAVDDSVEFRFAGDFSHPQKLQSAIRWTGLWLALPLPCGFGIQPADGFPFFKDRLALAS